MQVNIDLYIIYLSLENIGSTCGHVFFCGRIYEVAFSTREVIYFRPPNKEIRVCSRSELFIKQQNGFGLAIFLAFPIIFV